MKRNVIWIAPLAVLGVLLFVFVGGEVVKLLWNWLLPPLLGWPAITFWQALGLLVLCRLLFRGFGYSGSGRSRVRRRIGERIEERMQERTAHLTPEERERCRQRMRACWGFAAPPDESPANDRETA